MRKQGRAIKRERAIDKLAHKADKPDHHQSRPGPYILQDVRSQVLRDSTGKILRLLPPVPLRIKGSPGSLLKIRVHPLRTQDQRPPKITAIQLLAIEKRHLNRLQLHDRTTLTILTSQHLSRPQEHGRGRWTPSAEHLRIRAIRPVHKPQQSLTSHNKQR